MNYGIVLPRVYRAPPEISYSHTRVCKIQSPLLFACKILPGRSRNLHFAKNRSETTTALKLLNRMSMSHVFFYFYFLFLSFAKRAVTEKKRSFHWEKIDSFMNEGGWRKRERGREREASYDNGCFVVGH